MRIGKSRYIESNRTHCYIVKFNAALSLCGVLEVTLYSWQMRPPEMDLLCSGELWQYQR